MAGRNPGEQYDLVQGSAERVAVIRVPGADQAADAPVADRGRGHRDLDPELVFLVSFALADAFDLWRDREIGPVREHALHERDEPRPQGVEVLVRVVEAGRNCAWALKSPRLVINPLSCYQQPRCFTEGELCGSPPVVPTSCSIN